MKSFLPLIIIAFNLNVLSQENPFAKLKYDKVIAYEFNGTAGWTIDIVLERDRSRFEQQRILTETQTLEFEKIISKSGAYGQATAACFDPHFAIVYYNKNEVVAQVDICLMCNYLTSSIKIPSQWEVLYDKGTEFERPARGFSKSTRKKLDSFIKELGFTKYLKPLESIFDE